MMGMPLKNRKIKVEKPRPLKLCTLGDQSLESVLQEMDGVAQYLNSSTCDRSAYPAVVALCENLKMFGPQLENVYKDQLDKCYISLRNGCRDDRLSLAVRYRLLEVIELRAMHWQPNENLINYYKQKLVQIEAEEAALDEQNTGDTSTPGTPGITFTPTTTTTSSLVMPGLQPFQQTIYSQLPQQTPTQPQVQTPATPTLLSPGEIIKNSGKFAKPTRIPGKNYCKDEVVIRNADSGKVMGIKGRRVHMIEELSETIISFQRVAPGARERLVQITGPAEENINQAKQLIEETIRRNASPVRSDERSSSGGGSIFTSLGGSSSSISSHTSDETLQVLRKQLSMDELAMWSKRNTLVHSQSVGEEPLGEYRYTVTRGADALRITGANLHLVRTAKLVLDEFFNGERNLNNIAALLGADGACDHPPSAESPTTPGCAPGPHSPTTPTTPSQSHYQAPSPTAEVDGNTDSVKSSMVTVLRQPLFPSSSKEAIESAESSSQPGDQSSKNRRALFQKTSEDRANGEDMPGATTTTTTSTTSTTTTTTLPDAVPDHLPASPSPPPRRFYTRDFLVKCANSPLSQRTPVNWSAVVRQMPVVMKKSWQYLAGVTATLSEQGEAAISGVPTYMQKCDLEDASVLATRELTWTLIRSMSIQEDDDNGNAS
ncbi:eukaryotic translation initiation factor 4E-binding protein Mextli-like isoform X5 [Portunus trituberculatus]|nr:eukaryotic translation initiation factor 4E-binding protein Mextli-like isoform X2 [Portunus trituberculatus]XP_045106955.1 eukaryotic translation initiation factor 4E-binding protein Mextli-like isoform X5 [Portunus trituberculatus]